MGDRVDRWMGRLLKWGGWLALPVALLLFAQWPLRDIVQAYSRQANDLAQWLFALYIAMALSMATRTGSHLAVDAVARRYPRALRRWIERAADWLFLAPWAVYLLTVGGPAVAQSLLQAEGFPDTYNPGYFMIRVAGWVMALLVLIQIGLNEARRLQGR